MKKHKRILSALLALNFMFGSIALPVSLPNHFKVQVVAAAEQKDWRARAENLHKVLVRQLGEGSKLYEYCDIAGRCVSKKSMDQSNNDKLVLFVKNMNSWWNDNAMLETTIELCEEIQKNYKSHTNEYNKAGVVLRYCTEIKDMYKPLLSGVNSNSNFFIPVYGNAVNAQKFCKMGNELKLLPTSFETLMDQYTHNYTGPLKQDDSESASEDDTDGDRDVNSSSITDSASSIAEKESAVQNAALEEALKIMSEDEKDSYTIASNKYMTQLELDAFKWNLIVSQFSVPYRDSLQDTLQSQVFADINTDGLVIKSNPYTDAINIAAENMGKGFHDELLKDNKLIVSTEYNMSDILNTLGEENEISYAPLYTDDGKDAYISNLFDSNALYVHDKTTYYGSGVLDNDSLAKTLQNFQDKYAHLDLNEALNMIQGYSEVKDLKLPVWIQTDGVLFYNVLFVADAIRMGGYGTYKNFIEQIGNNRLYVDRWGNICSKINTGEDTKYVIVYPSYANPLYTSSGTEENDLVGVGYTINSQGSIFNIKPEDVNNGVKPIPNNIALTMEDAINQIYLSDSVTADTALKTGDTIFTDAYLGNTEKLPSVWKSSVLDGLGTPVSTMAYSRTNSSVSGTTGSIPYILRVDNTKNFFVNNTILTNYSRDTAYDSSQGAYGCLRDRITAYAQTSGLAGYKYGSSATFGDTLIFDKYNVHMRYTEMGSTAKVSSGKGGSITDWIYHPSSISIGDTNGQYICFPVRLYSSNKTIIGADPKNAEMFFSDFSKSSGVVTKNNNPLDTNYNNIVPIKGTNSSGLKNQKKTVMFPSLVTHSYRKGLYTDSLSRISDTKLLFWNVNFKGFNDLFSMENVFNIPSKANTVNYYPVEMIWDDLYLDSDNYKTWAVLNYDASVIPYNVSARLICENVEGADSSTMVDTSKFEKYCAIPLLDTTIDLADSWGLWDTSSVISAPDRAMDRESTGDRVKDTKVLSNYFSKYEGFMNPTPISISGSDGQNDKNFSVLRYYLKDQRISDVLEDYPVSDVTLMAYVWLNYYLPKSSLTTKVPVVSGTVISDGTLSGDTAVIATATSTPEVTTTATTGDDGAGAPAPTTEQITLAGSEIIPEDAVITPYNMITDDCNLRLVFTCENDADNGDIIYSTESVTKAGEFKSVHANVTASIVQVNIPTLLLAVNKNTNGDNLVYLRNKVSEIKANTDELLSRISLFLEKPATALYNIFQGLLQWIHYSVSAGSFGTIYDNTWITKKVLDPIYLPIAAAAVIIVVAFGILVQGLRALGNRGVSVLDVIRSIPRSTFFGLLPLIVIYTLNWSMNTIAVAMTKGISSKLALVHMEQEVKSQESLNLNFETQYQIFKEQFDDISDNFGNLSVNFLQDVDANGDKKIQTVSIKKLYDDVSYNSILANQNVAARAAELKIDEFIDSGGAVDNTFSVVTTTVKRDKDKGTYTSILGSSLIGNYYEDFSTGHSPLYYTYEKFVPVNYDKYEESIFYYFYDWLKYQYLRYWATHDSGNTEVFSSLAKDFTQPQVTLKGSSGLLNGTNTAIDTATILNSDVTMEKWSTYIERMYNAEQNMFTKAYGGVNYMYQDATYVYGDLYADDGSVISEDNINDLFGLSYLFHMTETFPAYADGTDSAYYPVLSNYYICNRNGTGRNSSIDTLQGWAKLSRGCFETRFKTYQSLCNMLSIRREPYDTFNPIAYIANGANWEYYSKSGRINSGDNDLLYNYHFTPDYMVYNDVGSVYRDYSNTGKSYTEGSYQTSSSLQNEIKLYGSMRGINTVPFASPLNTGLSRYVNVANGDSDVVSAYLKSVLAQDLLGMGDYNIVARNQTELAKFVDNSFYSVKGRPENVRAPYNVYASKGSLLKSVYDPSTKTFGNASMTDLEKSLVGLNESIYANAQEICNFMPGDMRDATMIFALALSATFEFNKTFGGGKAEPQALNTQTITLDDIMRVSFAENVDQIVKQKNVVYMLFDAPGGAVVGTAVVIGEVLLLVALLIRFLLMALLFIGAVIFGFGNLIWPRKANKAMCIGLGSQWFALVLSQFFLLGSTNLLFSTFEFNDVWFTNIIKGLLVLLCYYFVLVMNYKMLSAMVLNFKEFGGTVIANTLESARSRIQNLMAPTAHIAAGAVNVNINENVKVAERNRMSATGISKEKLRSNITAIDSFGTSSEVSIPPSSPKTGSVIQNRPQAEPESRERTTPSKVKHIKVNSKERANFSKMSEDKQKSYLCRIAAKQIVKDGDIKTTRKAASEIYKYMSTGKIKNTENEEVIKKASEAVNKALSNEGSSDKIRSVRCEAKEIAKTCTYTQKKENN